MYAKLCYLAIWVMLDCVRAALVKSHDSCHQEDGAIDDGGMPETEQAQAALTRGHSFEVLQAIRRQPKYSANIASLIVVPSTSPSYSASADVYLDKPRFARRETFIISIEPLEHRQP